MSQPLPAKDQAGQHSSANWAERLLNWLRLLKVGRLDIVAGGVSIHRKVL